MFHRNLFFSLAIFLIATQSQQAVADTCACGDGEGSTGYCQMYNVPNSTTFIPFPESSARAPNPTPGQHCGYVQCYNAFYENFSKTQACDKFAGILQIQSDGTLALVTSTGAGTASSAGLTSTTASSAPASTQYDPCENLDYTTSKTDINTGNGSCPNFTLDEGCAHVAEPSLPPANSVNDGSTRSGTYSFANINAMVSSGGRTNALTKFNQAESTVYTEYVKQCGDLHGTAHSNSPRFTFDEQENNGWYYFATGWATRTFCCVFSNGMPDLTNTLPGPFGRSHP